MASSYVEAVQDISSLIDTICSGEVSNPDWINILELCDLVTSSAEQTTRSLQRVFGHRQHDENSISLALLVTESVLNNCPGFYNHLASRLFLQEVVALVDHSSPAVQERATRMLQDWAANYPDQSIFRDTYQQLRVQGVSFPSTPASPSSITSRDFAANVLPATAIDEAKPAATMSPILAAEFQKLHQDLVTVQEKIQTYQTLVALGARGDDDNHDVEDVLDFLQQCQPRMNSLIEAGLAGKLDERTLEICLTVNDRLICVLEGSSVDNESKPASTTYLAGPVARLTSSTPSASLFGHADAGTYPLFPV
ncbi:hypothetical protein DYB36_013688 [Aphanomyces astaci]|uniref:VHS domain-containing protein n=1 Tax=Aphanomyces astaci TaxID=112090 RepID=A0A397B909_APHAT|nr:hypothetical protein DYB36_013688 [Aphanomyces astaci]